MAKVILICGKICSGKSFLAKQLKETENAVILSTDEATYDLIHNQQGAFYNAFAARVNGYLRKKCVEIVRAGTNVILDWGFWSRNARREISDYFAANSTQYEWHYIDISNGRWQKQISERNEKVKKETNCSDFYVDEGLLKKCQSLFEEPSRDEIDVWHENQVTDTHYKIQRPLHDEAHDRKIELIKENEINDVCEMVIRACRYSKFAAFYPERYFYCTYEEIKAKAEGGHFYVVKENGKIIACGGIAPYFGSETESWIYMVFVEPTYQKKGFGKMLIEFLEQDDYAKRATRIEIHAAMSAIPFYRKLGYTHKNGDLIYAEGHFDLEKFR